jgi:hypothetical protein
VLPTVVHAAPRVDDMGPLVRLEGALDAAHTLQGSSRPTVAELIESGGCRSE